MVDINRFGDLVRVYEKAASDKSGVRYSIQAMVNMCGTFVTRPGHVCADTVHSSAT